MEYIFEVYMSHQRIASHTICHILRVLKPTIAKAAMKLFEINGSQELSGNKYREIFCNLRIFDINDIENCNGELRHN